MTTKRQLPTSPTVARPPLDGVRLVLAGAPVSNDNRGVEALGRSVIDHFSSADGVTMLSVLDGGWGVRAHAANVELVGARTSRRWHRRESWARVRFDQRFGGLGNPVARRLSDADAVMDLSGGDSFTDLYGPRRLATICAPKEAALRAGRPLVLLPQTFGPFTTADGRDRAAHLVRSASLAYARDAWSLEQLHALAGPDADHDRLHLGVDVAFGLTPQAPDESTSSRLHSLAGDVVVGVNVSGLLTGPEAGRRFGLAGDYVSTVRGMVSRLISDGAFVVFVPHVHGDGEEENDRTLMLRMRAGLTPAEQARTWILPGGLRAAELKWCIGRMDWFTGSRMHATIAALSSGVPAFGYAYSDKTRGVFGTCGVADQVADARETAGQEAVEVAMQSFSDRARTRAVLAARVPDVVARAHGQLDDVFASVTSRRGHQPVRRKS